MEVRSEVNHYHELVLCQYHHLYILHKSTAKLIYFVGYKKSLSSGTISSNLTTNISHILAMDYTIGSIHGSKFSGTLLNISVR